jgi:hypothetical protein
MEATDSDWFQGGEVEVTAAVEALKVNLIVWDMENIHIIMLV